MTKPDRSVRSTPKALNPGRPHRYRRGERSLQQRGLNEDSPTRTWELGRKRDRRTSLPERKRRAGDVATAPCRRRPLDDVRGDRERSAGTGLPRARPRDVPEVPCCTARCPSRIEARAVATGHPVHFHDPRVERREGAPGPRSPRATQLPARISHSVCCRDVLGAGCRSRSASGTGTSCDPTVACGHFVRTVLGDRCVAAAVPGNHRQRHAA